MQCRFLLAFFVSCLTLSVAAAPIAIAVDLTLSPENLARAPLPVPESPEVARAPEPEPGCKMYSCIWYVLLLLDLDHGS
ncbi:hypothetical protein C8R46DRAFT_1213710 [Mycena filopes]|nr:hypothetical protein C8R46DRAFT_1213702 [Mycena filopes]KAJ7177155.1 hypothetical protein C8R46DRAFT_1213710 [Mycena filopes]